MHPDDETIYHLMIDGVDPLKLTGIKLKKVTGCFNSLKMVFKTNFRRLTNTEGHSEDSKLMKFIENYNFRRLVYLITILVSNIALKPNRNSFQSLVNTIILFMLIVNQLKLFTYENSVYRFFGLDKMLELGVFMIALVIQLHTLVNKGIEMLELENIFTQEFAFDLENSIFLSMVSWVCLFTAYWVVRLIIYVRLCHLFRTQGNKN